MMTGTERWVVLLAGGVGSRLWPKSRATYPKQFQDWGANQSLLQASFAFAAQCVGAEHVLVVTTAPLAPLVHTQLAKVDSCQVLIEPEGKGTAGSIAYGTAEVAKRGGKVMTVLPTDHWVGDEIQFLDAITQCMEASVGDSGLILLGEPAPPGHLPFGYILAEVREGEAIHPVRRFVEKPTKAVCLQLFEEKARISTGIFIGQVASFKGAFNTHLPGAFEALCRIEKGGDVEAYWPLVEQTSFDHGILNDSEKLFVLYTDMNWRDLGTWQSLDAWWNEGGMLPKRAQHLIEMDGSHNVVDAPEKSVVLIGVSDLLIVNSGQTLLICKRSDVDKIENARDLLEEALPLPKE